jgi:serine/threonine protein kinase/Tol biopolymer transport system component
MTEQTILHYKILEKLGEGGMGIVYKAQDTKLNRTVALKFLPDKVNQDAEAKKRFQQEAQAVAALNHSNICTIHGIEESGGSLFMVMEYVDGGTLSSKIPFNKINDALKTAVEIGEALQEAHSKGIVHRDIKADNIMLTANGQARVMDFGLAKLKGALRLTKSLSTVGTLGYMSPEQIQGGEVDNRSDIFSFGVLLFEMLTGSLPFRGEHEAAIVYSVVNEEPQDIATLVPDLSPLVVNLIQRCLEKDPEDRFQNMQDIVSELKRAMKKSSGSMARSSITRKVVVPQTSEVHSVEQPVTAAHQKSYLQRKYIIGLGGLIVIAAAALFLFHPWKHSVEINPDMQVRALDLPITNIGYPGLSGDGNWAAFPGRDAGRNWHIYFMNTSGGEPKAITDNLTGGFPADVDVSYDGSRVVYDLVNSNGLNYASSIYVTSSLGGGTKLLSQNAIIPRWRPDGKRIFYISGWVLGKGNFTEIRSVTPEGTDDRLEFTDTLSSVGLIDKFRLSLSVSPDGKSVAWQRNFPGGYQEIMTHNLSTGEERQLTNDKKNIDEVCWASNNQIIFSSNKSGNTNLWMIPSEGGIEIQITKGPGPDFGIKISTDLKKLIYYQTQNVGDLWTGNLNTETFKQITFDDRHKVLPVISQDGQLVAFSMQDGDFFSAQLSVFTCNSDGSNRRKIVSNNGQRDLVTLAGWSPDGRQLAYRVENRADTLSTNKSYVVEPGSGQTKYVADGIPRFWLNSDSLLILNKDNSWISSVSTGNVTHFFEDSTFAFPLPGNSFVVYKDLHSNANPDYWIVPVDASFKRKGSAKKIELKKFGNKGYKTLYASSSRDYLLFINDGNKLLRYWLANGKEELMPEKLSEVYRNGSFLYTTKSGLVSFAIVHSKGKLIMIDNLFE